MRKIYFYLIVIVLINCRAVYSFAQCGLYEITLNEKVNESDFVIEGEVVKQQCYKSKRFNKIYTLNTIKVFGVLKGNIPQEISIVTAGGKLINERETSSSLLSLQLGEKGMFFLNRAPDEPNMSQNKVYNVFASAQGFLKYNLSEELITDVFNQYARTKFFKQLLNEFGLQNTIVYQPMEWGYHSVFNRLTVINNFSPTTVNAGIGNQITINGFGFGSTRGDGKVLFKNSDDGGITEIEAEAPQYISWSDTKIVLEVPGKAGTGKIIVDIGTASAQSNVILKVNYAIINTGGSAQVYPARHVARNSNQGYVWNMNENFEKDSVALANFLISFKKWRCLTYINWTIGNSTAINRSERDTLSVITFDETNELPAGVLGLCYSYYSGCSDDDWYIEEQDMLFRKSDKWHFGEAIIPFNKLDFQSVALHELGHAHQLGHIINATDLMNYSINNGVQKRNIETFNLEAALWMINKSQESDICNKKKMQMLDSELCNDELFGYYNTVVYPNPFDEFFNIDFYLTKNDRLKIVLFDVTGKFITEYENLNAAKGFFPVVFDLPNHLISAGVYVLKIEIGEEKSIKKLIKQ